MRGVNACLDNFQPPLKIPEINGWLLPLGSALTALHLLLLVFLPSKHLCPLTMSAQVF
jgi:hypothetical protein